MKLKVCKNTEITDWLFHGWRCTCPMCSAKSIN